ncbi:MAG: carboxypeptidase regulatory-like domain-containing protein [Acidobacteriota bacterium]|nr:carboxypeptidase regulatory-like domain-containing protein [Acidobacteriota bacterium]
MVLLLSLSTTLAWGQTTSTGTVSGQVTDQQNAIVAGAEIKMADPSTNVTLTTTSNEAGRYILVNVQPGSYNVTINHPGFAQARVQGQKVDVGSTLTLNFTLQVGSTSTTVEVKVTAAAELQTTNAAVGTTLTSEALMVLPNMGRDVSTLMVLQPGVTPGGFTAGAYADQNTFTLDGGNNSDDMAGNNTSYVTNFTGQGGTQTNGNPSGVLPTPVESIEEFRVTTFNQTADFNSSIGGEVQMVTKRGTNQWHGSGYGYYFATNIGAANTWVNNHTPSALAGTPYTPLPSNHRDRFGATLGGPIGPRFLGGKTYFFFNYEGLRFPNVSTYERPVPSALMRLGVIQVPDSSGVYRPYNLNPFAVTGPDGTIYQPAQCGGQNCDPRGIGINPIVSKIFNTQMPLPNDPIYQSNGADRFNVQGFLSTVRAPLTSDSYVGRIDHDFGDKWRFMSSYRFLRLVSLTTNQVDIGGVLPGDKLGQPAAVAPRDQVPGFFVAGLTTTINPTTTNNFVFNYTRNFWQWGSANAPPQLPGLGGAVEIASGATNSIAESSTAANILIPYNINTQSVRQRFWDGQDKLFRDDVSMIKGTHLFQFGGLYQRNYDYHSRTDNGAGVNNQIVYQIGSAGINFTNSPYIPSTVPSSQFSAYQNLYSEVLGLVNQPQVAYTRAGKDLTLQPIGSSAFDQSLIPTYNVYFSDTWHVKPTFTLTYGISYTLEMPPYEKNGKQVEVVGPDGNIFSTADYLAARKKAALAGQVYQPNLGFATVNHVGSNGIKYPYDPFYGGVSPRVAAAWNPRFSDGILGHILGDGKTVIRGGYGRIFGRLNGVNLVLVPLLGPGLLQSVSCSGASRSGQCLGSNNVDPSNAFRIGTDGLSAPLPAASQTLPQPFFPGVGGNAPSTDVNVLDPKYRPERTDNFSFTLQRELSSKMTLEVGYIGRIIKNEFQEINLDAVPYMTTLGGQSFAQAFAALYAAVPATGAVSASANLPAQPFFETALGGAGSAYCSGYSNCTTAVASKSTSSIRNTAVSDLWAAMNRAPSWVLGRTMISSPINGGSGQATAIATTTSLGFGNYNALFVTFRARDFHGLTAVSNFTWGRALGTGTLGQANSSNTALDIWNLGANYGPNNFDIRFIYNLAMYYQPPYFKGQHGVMGHILGGWTISPLFTAQSGVGTSVTYSEGSCTGCQAFGEVSAGSSFSSTTENAVGASHFTGGNSSHQNVSGSNGVGTNNPTGLNMFSDPATVLTEFRRCILGSDTSCGGYYNLRNLPTWNLDATVAKDINLFRERVGATLIFQFTNLLNHFQPGTPSLSLTSPTNFGKITTQANTPRNMEFGLRIHF